MPYICYKAKQFRGESLAIVHQARAICDEYAGRGYDLTLRQLYYQFVARGIIANKQSEYKRLGGIVNDARLAGLIDWDHLVDRTRNPEIPSAWTSPANIIAAAADSFHIDKWLDQENYVEVWVEKEALAGVVERIGEQLQVTTLACRGYMSQSEQWTAAQRLGKVIRSGRQPHIIHLGDHDPSGIDMTRDNDDRLALFTTSDGYRNLSAKPETLTYNVIHRSMVEQWGAQAPLINRIALNWDQIEQYSPPPNPAKSTDARYRSYQEQYGDESWELDALPPDVLTDLIEDAVLALRDIDAWEAAEAREAEMITQLQWARNNWGQVAALASEAGA